MLDERRMRRRPRHAERRRDLRDAARGVADRGTHRGAQPASRARPGRHLPDRLSERQPGTRRFSTAPPRLVPAHRESGLSVGQIDRAGDHVALHRRRHHRARRATRRRRALGGLHMHRSGTVLIENDPLHPNSGQPEQHRRTLIHSPWPLSPVASQQQLSRGRGSLTSGAQARAETGTVPGQVRRDSLTVVNGFGGHGPWAWSFPASSSARAGAVVGLPSPGRVRQRSSRSTSFVLGGHHGCPPVGAPR